MNIFLTGDIQVGKSTLIRRILEARPGLRVGGFRTVPGPVKGDGLSDVYIVPAAGSAPLTDGDRVVSRWLDEGSRRIMARPDVFDRLGCKLLEHRDNCDLLIMDEIGVQEAEAIRFQQAVLHSLDGNTPVLGVVRSKKGILTDAVRSHPKTKLVTVTVENRDELLKDLLEWIG